MAAARREERRRLALDVRAMVWHQGKFDAELYVRTGGFVERRQYAAPDGPGMRAAREQARKDKAEQEAKRHGR